MKLQHQIALAFRNRPLLGPMLLALACLDLAVAAFVLNSEINWPYWAILFPQLALTAIWTAEGGGHRLARLAASAGFLFLLGLVLSGGSAAELMSLLAVYYVAVTLLWGLIRLLWRDLSSLASPELPRYSVFRLLVLITIAAPAAVLVRFFDWPLASREVPVLLVFIAIPLIARFASLQIRPQWAWPILPIALAILLDITVVSGFDELYACTTTQSLVCVVVLWILNVPADADRRRAARRERQSPKLSVVDLPQESSSDKPEVVETTSPIDYDV